MIKPFLKSLLLIEMDLIDFIDRPLHSFVDKVPMHCESAERGKDGGAGSVLT